VAVLAVKAPVMLSNTNQYYLFRDWLSKRSVDHILFQIFYVLVSSSSNNKALPMLFKPGILSWNFWNFWHLLYVLGTSVQWETEILRLTSQTKHMKKFAKNASVKEFCLKTQNFLLMILLYFLVNVQGWDLNGNALMYVCIYIHNLLQCIPLTQIFFLFLRCWFPGISCRITFLCCNIFIWWWLFSMQNYTVYFVKRTCSIFSYVESLPKIIFSSACSYVVSIILQN